jgi:hypothetical protein
LGWDGEAAIVSKSRDGEAAIVSKAGDGEAAIVSKAGDGEAAIWSGWDGEAAIVSKAGDGEAAVPSKDRARVPGGNRASSVWRGEAAVATAQGGRVRRWGGRCAAIGARWDRKRIRASNGANIRPVDGNLGVGGDVG